MTIIEHTSRTAQNRRVQYGASRTMFEGTLEQCREELKRYADIDENARPMESDDLLNCGDYYYTIEP